MLPYSSVNGTRQYGGEKGYGHVRAPSGHKTTPFSRFKARWSSQTPSGAADLSSSAPWILDQGQTSACEGHGWATAITIALDRADDPLGFIPSPKGIYDVGRCIDRLDWSQKLTDDGSMTNQIERGVNEWGIRPMGKKASDGRNSDCEPKTINDEPTLSQLETDDTTRLIGSYSLDDMNTLINDACLSLDNGVPLATAIFVDMPFERWDPKSGPLGIPNMNDPEGGGHLICVLGYRTDANGKRIFKFANSWGENFGVGGYGEGNEDWFFASYERYAVRVRKVAP